MAHSMEDFAATYADMSNDELIRLYADRVSLLPEAATALDSEYKKRQLGISGDLEQPVATSDAPKERNAGLSWWARLIIFLVWGMAVSSIMLYFIGARFSEETQGQLAKHVGAMFVYSVMFLTGASSFVKEYLNVKRTMMLATVLYSLGIGVLAVSMHKPNEEQDKVKQLMDDLASLRASSQEFSRNLEQVIRQEPKDFAGFLKRENELETLLDSDSSREQEVQSLLKQLHDMPPTNQSIQSPLSLMQRGLDDDLEAFAALREEIACARVLSRSAISERSKFRRICLDATQDRIRPLAEDEETITRKFKERGYKAPNQ